MPDLSIFKLDSQTITIKDITARDAADSAKTLATTAIGNATTALNKVTELESEKADAIISSASGVIASFPDGAARPVDDLTVQIEPVQDLHGYDHPWPGGGGVNQFAIADAVGVSLLGATYGLTITLDNTAETIRVHGTPNWSDTNMGVTFRCISTAKGGYYGDAPVTHDYSGMAYKIFPISLSSNVSAITSLGISSDMITVSLAKTGNAEIDVLFKIVIATAGTTIGDWTPYSNICPITGWTGTNVTVSPTTDAEDGHTYSITFPTEAGTVYGGTLDVTNGVLTVYRAQIASYAGETLPSTWISDRDVYSAGATPTTGAQVVYELATPITYHLTPQEITTLLGQNNIWADTGDTSVTYKADTKLYIDKKFTELQALILEN